MKHIVIAGGSGFIGTALANILHSSGYKVYVLSRKESKEFDTYSRIQWDANSKGEWTTYLHSARAVINLTGANVGIRRWSNQYKKEILSSRVDSTSLLVSVINDSTTPPEVFISASGVGYYGDKPFSTICDENHSNGNDFLATVCSQWEEATSALRNDVRKVILRIGVVLDPEEGALAKLAFPYKFFVGGSLGSGKQTLSWIHREDLVKIFKFSLDNQKIQGVYNASAPNPVQMKEFSSTIGKVLHRPSIFPVPSFAIRLLLGELSSIVLLGQNAPPLRLLEAGFHFDYEKIEPAIRNLLK